MRGQSTRQPIEFKQKYTLDSWAKATIRSDPSIPSGSFGFYNGVNAAGIVYINTGDAEPVPSKFRACSHRFKFTYLYLSFHRHCEPPKVFNDLQPHLSSDGLV